MSSSVVPQVDVGSLTLKGLSAFTPILAALTTDNVAPMAMIQLESLGSLFHISGPYAAEVPNLLRRCPSVALDRIAMAIGWRKGDTASLMAQSSGGQAVALMCFCLMNTCKKCDLGPVLYDLSEVILAKSLSVHSSISQLEDAANLLAAKLQVIGFGNVLAEQVVRIQDAYAQLNIPLPRDFFDVLTRESMVDLFRSLWVVFQEEDTILRISGVHTMGHIIAIMLIMFPENVMLIIEGLLVREGPRPSIILEVTSSSGSGSATTVQIERKLDHSSDNPLPLEFVSGRTDNSYTFTWIGHIADFLQIEFMNAGLRCSQDLRQACADLLAMSVPLLRNRTDLSSEEHRFPPNGMVDLLGSNSTQRISQTCNDVFRTKPSDETVGRETKNERFLKTYALLVDAFYDTLGNRVTCSFVGENCCHISKGWQTPLTEVARQAPRPCLQKYLWNVIGVALEHGYYCLLTDAQPKSTLTIDTSIIPLISTTPDLTIGLGSISWGVAYGGRMFAAVGCGGLHRLMMASIGAEQSKEVPLTSSHGGCTLVPAALLDLRVDITKGYRYRLLDGMLMVKGRYYKRLRSSITTARRPTTSSSLTSSGEPIRPSSSGEHTSLSFTIQETSRSLNLRTTVFVKGHSLHLNITDIIIASMGLIDGPTCKHNVHNALDPAMPRIKTISVANVQGTDGTVAIAQTMGNPTAQMLACDRGIVSVLQRNCCLECAVGHAMKVDARQVIVAL